MKVTYTLKECCPGLNSGSPPCCITVSRDTRLIIVYKKHSHQHTCHLYFHKPLNYKTRSFPEYAKVTVDSTMIHNPDCPLGDPVYTDTQHPGAKLKFGEIQIYHWALRGKSKHQPCQLPRNKVEQITVQRTCYCRNPTMEVCSL